MARDREWALSNIIGNFSSSSSSSDHQPKPGWMMSHKKAAASGSSSGAGETHFHFEKSGDHHIAMRALSLCDGLIIGQSSFGWWAAYLSNSSEVVAPRNIHSQNGPRVELEDYFLPWWTLLSSNAAEDRIAGDWKIAKRAKREKSREQQPKKFLSAFLGKGITRKGKTERDREPQ